MCWASDLAKRRIDRGANVRVRLAGAGDRGGDAALLAAERARGDIALGSRGADDGGNGEGADGGHDEGGEGLACA